MKRTLPLAVAVYLINPVVALAQQPAANEIKPARRHAQPVVLRKLI